MGLAVAVASVAVAISAPQAHGIEAHCLEARAPLAAGAIPASANFMPVACPAGGMASAFRYDRTHGCTHAARTIAAGEIVPAYPEFERNMIEPGQSLRLVVSDGPVRIERTVEAMQAAKSGEKLFVKTDDGQILSVRYESAAP